ncbi:DUF4174 domain-containing protein [Marinicella sp. S1101]|uniref:DUF4174 domain-containing protein n=1 Tax=Marinicella marina TaxID=2996016 RepID=UPI0022609182|nr:DUF4174 domain-containing protein [Marinicella marina]MCX7554336.1 DUF4174 domain-containing protein [Marinicella marina]MDJ1138673.1 DUF4174 domain-containing protein [Marinicella marina]
MFKASTTSTPMLPMVASLLLSIFSGNALASNKPANALNDITDLQWQHRIILINDIENLDDVVQLLEQNKDEIQERDILWFVLSPDGISTNHTQPLSAELKQNILKTYPMKSNQVILIGKDGGVKSRFSALQLNDIFSEIDAMPMRQAEMRRDN